MVLSESIVRAIHADRVREMERAAREQRLIHASAEPVATSEPATRSVAPKAPAKAGRSGAAA